MKNLKILLNCLIVLSAISISAQNNYSRNSSGNFNGNTNTSNPEFENEKRKEAVEKAKAQNIETTVTKLTADLQLDALQVIAIKQVIVESVRIEGIILKKEETDEEKIKAINALAETTDTKIKAYLNQDQIEKFVQLKENLRKKKKK